MRRAVSSGELVRSARKAAIVRSSRVRMKAYAPEDKSYYQAVPIGALLPGKAVSRPDATKSYRQRFGRAISMDWIERALVSAHSGNMMQLTDLSRETIETDPHLGAVLNKRFGAVSCLPYELRPASGLGVDKARALYYAVVAREQLQNLPRFRQSLRQLAWALFDGRAALEAEFSRVYAPAVNGFGAVSIAITGLGWIHPRRLSFGPNRELVAVDEVYGSNTGGSFGAQGVNLDAYPAGKFITWQPQMFGEYQEREGLAPRCMYWSFFKRFGQRERMILLELFGKPWRIIEVDEKSTAGDEQLTDADDAVDGLGSSYSARLPRGTKLNVVQPGRTAGQVHAEVIKDCDEQISKLVLGQTGTTDGVPAGLNSNQASVMQGEQLMILTSDAAELSEIIETQLTDVIIGANFGPDAVPMAPTFVLRSDLPSDRVREIERLKGALDAGLEVSLAEAYEISGFRQPERTEPVLRVDQPPTAPLAPTPPASRPVIAWPEGESPPAGEQQPITPIAGEGIGAREGSGVSVGSADQGKILTVNEARAGQGLPPLTLPDGSPDPDGDLTVAEFEAKRIGKSDGEIAPEVPAAPELLSAIPMAVQLVLRKSGGQWCVYSEDGSRSFGCYPTKGEAEDRLRQVEAFKHMQADEPTVALLARCEADERELELVLSAVSAAGRPERQPDSGDGSVDDVLDAVREDANRAMAGWGEAFATAFEKLTDPADIARAAERVRAGLGLRGFAEVLERSELHALALGALDAAAVEEPVKAATARGVDRFARIPFDDAMRAFKARNVLTRAQFDRLTEAARRRAFTAAAMTSTQMLRLVHAELAKMIREGADVREFATSFRARLQSSGFVAASPKAEAAYVDTVFRTNTLGAYNAGRHARMSNPAVVKLRPYWQIRGIADDRQRETHREADGLILKANDPFWQRAYPPFSFNCRCRVVSLSEQQVAGRTITDGATITYLPDPGFTSGVAALLSGGGWALKQVLLDLDIVMMERAVQTIAFDKAKFTRAEALAWCKTHDFSADTSRETESEWRVRQRPPDDFKQDTFRTKEIDDGVSIVDGEIARV